MRGVLVDGQKYDKSRTTYIETVIIGDPVRRSVVKSRNAMDTDENSKDEKGCNHNLKVRRVDYKSEVNTGDDWNIKWQDMGGALRLAPPRPVEVQKLDKCTTLVYTIREHELSFTEFIMSLRLILAEHGGHVDALMNTQCNFLNLSSTGEHPLLAEPVAEPGKYPERWIHVKLQLLDAEDKVEYWTTLVMADYNLYVHGFKNKNSEKVYGLNEKKNVCLLEDANKLGIGTSYSALVGADGAELERKLGEALKGRSFMREAVKALSLFEYNDEMKYNKDIRQQVGKHLGGLVFMICESARMNPVLNVFARAWMMGEDNTTDTARQSTCSGLMDLFVHRWGNGSEQLREWDGLLWLQNFWKLVQGIYLVLNKLGRDSGKRVRDRHQHAHGSSSGANGHEPRGPGGERDGQGQGGSSSGGSGSAGFAWGGGGGGGLGYFSWGTTIVYTTSHPGTCVVEYGNTTYTSTDTGKRHASDEPGEAPSPSRRKLNPQPGRDDVSQSQSQHGGSSGGGDKNGDKYDSPADAVEAPSTVVRGRPRVELLAIKPKSRDLAVPAGTKIIVFDGKRGHIVYECNKEGVQVGKGKDLVLTGPYRGISAEYGCFTIRIDIPNQESTRFEWGCDKDDHAEQVDRWLPIPEATISIPGGGHEVEVTYAVMSNAMDATVKLLLTKPAVAYGEVTAYIGKFTEGMAFQKKIGQGRKLFSRKKLTQDEIISSATDSRVLELDLARSVVAVPCNWGLQIELDLQIIDSSNTLTDLNDTIDLPNRASTAADKRGQVEAKVTWYPEPEIAGHAEFTPETVQQEIARDVGVEEGVSDSRLAPETEQALRAARELAWDAGHKEAMPLHLAMVLARDKQGILRQAIAQVSGGDGAVKFKKVLAKEIKKGKNPTPSNSMSLEDVIELARSEQDKSWSRAPLQLGQLVLSLHSDPHISSCYTVVAGVPKELVCQELEIRQELEMYGGHDLVAEARAGMLIDVISRDEEIDSVANILSSQNKKNAILVGEPGVGKEAVVRGLALRIARGDCSGLQGARLIALDMASLADGDAEKLLRKVVRVQEAQGKQGVILFIKDIHSVLGVNAPNLGMKQLLLRLCTDLGGHLRCIGSTTPENYLKYIDTDAAAFDPHFDKVDVPELSVEDTIFDILRAHKERLECHHGVRITDRALVTAARLASTYDITAGRRLPDKAIALVRKACIMVNDQESRLAEKVILEEKMTELKAVLGSPGEDRASEARRRVVKKQLRHLEGQMNELERILQYREWREEQLSELPESERRILPPSLLKNGSPDEIVLALIQHELREIKKKKNFLNFIAEKLKEEGNWDDKRKKALDEMLEELDGSKHAWEDFKESCESTKSFEDVILALTVGHQQIKEVVSQQANVPVLVVGLHERVVGQTEAVNAVVDAIEQAPSSSNQRKKPILFVGPTGVGKTELAKALAEQLFEDEEHFISIDMSEEDSVSRLIGEPPRYRGGLLTCKVPSKPRSVVLLDKVHKVDKNVLNILLEVLDGGKLRDREGNKVNMANTVIIMEYKHRVEDRHDGESSTSMDKRQNVDMDEVKRRFGPQLLDRLSKIVIFDHLSNDELRKIAHRQINVLERAFLESDFLPITGVTLRATDAAVDSILDKVQREYKKYDAKRVVKWIQSELKDKVDEVPLGDNCTVRINGLDGDNKLVYQVVERSGDNKDVSTDEDDYSSDEENDTDIEQVSDQSLGQLQSDTREKIKVEKEKIKQEEIDERHASGGPGGRPSSSRRKLDHEPGRDDVSQSGGSSAGDGDDSPADDVEARSTVARGRPPELGSPSGDNKVDYVSQFDKIQSDTWETIKVREKIMTHLKSFLSWVQTVM